ncbi:hypothetical protein EXIGLDRAFT_774352 [Exidia glandulosa HHB12029]|uniref:Uncharacterized protein n=1 Tax=Exidia glandulosa HHB12029 TaxID=1314781 RepID=A0A165EDX2_EXIGL|nr:hypothetical protein EXIGLDRAFT_774352 [Exidia glandulosa HHB12029]
MFGRAQQHLAERAQPQLQSSLTLASTPYSRPLDTRGTAQVSLVTNSMEVLTSNLYASNSQQNSRQTSSQEPTYASADPNEPRIRSSPAIAESLVLTCIQHLLCTTIPACVNPKIQHTRPTRAVPKSSTDPNERRIRWSPALGRDSYEFHASVLKCLQPLLCTTIPARVEQPTTVKPNRLTSIDPNERRIMSRTRARPTVVFAAPVALYYALSTDDERLLNAGRMLVEHAMGYLTCILDAVALTGPRYSFGRRTTRYDLDVCRALQVLAILVYVVSELPDVLSLTAVSFLDLSATPLHHAGLRQSGAPDAFPWTSMDGMRSVQDLDSLPVKRKFNPCIRQQKVKSQFMHSTQAPPRPSSARHHLELDTTQR